MRAADGAREDAAGYRRRRQAAFRLPGLDDIDTRDPLDRPPGRFLWIDLRHDEHRAVLTFNDPLTNRAGVATLLDRLGLPQRWHHVRRGYVIALDEVPDVEALAVRERWLVRYRKPGRAVTPVARAMSREAGE